MQNTFKLTFQVRICTKYKAILTSEQIPFALSQHRSRTKMTPLKGVHTVMVYSHCGPILQIGPQAVVTLWDVTDARRLICEQSIHTVNTELSSSPSNATAVHNRWDLVWDHKNSRRTFGCRSQLGAEAGREPRRLKHGSVSKAPRISPFRLNIGSFCFLIVYVPSIAFFFNMCFATETCEGCTGSVRYVGGGDNSHFSLPLWRICNAFIGDSGVLGHPLFFVAYLCS